MSAVLLLMVACSGAVDPLTDGGAGGGAGTAGGSNGGGSGGTGGGAPSCSNISGDRQTQVCLRWTCDRMDIGEGTWEGGSLTTCTPGDLSADGRANAVKLVNLYRFIAQLPPVTTSASRDAAAQACALIQDRNNRLSHTPQPDAGCYTASGAMAAGQSNISSGRAVRAIDSYMSDFGNETTIGHRRWLLSNQLGPMGIGGTTGASCHWVIGGSGPATLPWAAWPPAGPVPLQAIAIPGLPSIDSTGWTVQSYSGAWNVTGASVTVMDQGVNRPVTVAALLNGYGSPYAIKFTPMGWTSQIGHTYDVTVTGPSLAQSISYSVQVISCP